MTAGPAGAAIDALRGMLTRTVAVIDEAALAMADVYEKSVQEQLSLTSHAAGTPTPAPPGSSPAMISGSLRDSVTSMVVSNGVVQVGATTPYARIQQFGGLSGIGLSTNTPARPYLDEAWEKCADEARAAAIDVIDGELYG